MTAPLPHLLIPENAIQVEKVSLSDVQNLINQNHSLPITNILFLIETF